MTQSASPTTNMLAGHGIAKILKAYGIKYVFGIPDGHTLAFYDGLAHNDFIEHILVNDERTAGFAADAFARITNTIGVCDAGAAGSMNFPVALAEAKGSGSPVLALVGTVKTHDMLRNVPHDINVSGVLEAVTKWTGIVLNPDNLPRFLIHGIRHAINGRPGPVALIMAEDVLTSTELTSEDFVIREGSACSVDGCRITPSPSEIDLAVELIRKAKQPALFTGGEAVMSGAFAEVAKLAQFLHIPVFSTISGKGIMITQANFQNHYFGTVGLFGERPNHKFLRKEVDLLIVVGNRLTEDDTAYFKIPPARTPMIQIDLDPSIIGLSYQPWGIVGDPKETLREIISKLKSQSIIEGDAETIIKSRDAALQGLIEDHQKWREKDTLTWMNADPIKPPRILKAIADSLGPLDYLITDASASARWIGAYYPVKSLGRKIITARGVGPTGFGLGALLGTCFAIKSGYTESTTSRAVLLTGDGGLMNGGVADFETFLKYKLSSTIVVINNKALGFVKFGQGMLYKQRYYDTDRPTTDFSAIARGFGANGWKVEHLKDLDSTIIHAINSTGLNVVDILVDPKELLPPNFY